MFDDAIGNNITQSYPFRKFKIRPVATAKRSLSVDDLRAFINYPCEPFQQKYLDIFKLTFFLIGINLIDLCGLKRIENGYITYNRAKTGRLYHVKVELEVLEITDNYCGEAYLLKFMECFTSYKNLEMQVDRGIKRLGSVTMVTNPQKGEKCHAFIKKRSGLFPDLSLCWTRHT